jgi:hypothetical protein
MELAEHIRTRIRSALEAIPHEDRADIYAVSLWVSDLDDDPRRPTITVGYNTECQVAGCTPGPGQRPERPAASDPAEARWNFAFWLQNSVAVIGSEDGDPRGAELREAWARQRGFWYSEEEQARDLDAALEKVQPLTGEFVEIVAGVVQGLHRSGEIVRVFGRAIPVLIHELEYYDEIARQNEAANPPGVVDEFARWVRGS